MREQERAAEILHRVALFLRSLSADEIEDLLAGRVRLTLTERSPRKPASKAHGVEKLDIDGLRKELAAKTTREEGMSLLDDLELGRESLRHVAAAMDLPTPKTDTVARLKDRIVEATIGYRLRSEAIRSSD